MKRKAFLMLLCATLTIGCVAGFSGCGKDKKVEETAEVTEETEEEVVEEEESDGKLRECQLLFPRG